MNSTPLYSIVDWDKLFETDETRKRDSLRWVPVPNKHDGLGFRRVAAQRDSAELFAAWTLILQITSKGRRGERGRLMRDGRALTAEDMSLMTGFPERIFERALAFFSASQLGWIAVEGTADMTARTAAPDEGSAPVSPAPPATPTTCVQSDTTPSAAAPATPAGPPADHAGAPARKERNRKERREEGACAPKPLSPSNDTHLPTVDEVIAFGAQREIPEDYCRTFWSKTTEKGMWLNPRGQLTNWQMTLERWWKADSATWVPAAPHHVSRGNASETKPAPRLGPEPDPADWREWIESKEYPYDEYEYAGRWMREEYRREKTKEVA